MARDYHDLSQEKDLSEEYGRMIATTINWYSAMSACQK
jgi:hypothetical protein